MKKIISLFLVCLLTVLSIPFAAGAAYQGRCGDNLTWRFDDNGTLTVRGFGEMTDSPWREQNLPITDVVIDYGVTSIPDFECYKLSSINIPDSVFKIGDYIIGNTKFYDNRDNWEDSSLYVGKHLLEVKKTVSGSYTVKPGTLSIASSALSGCLSITGINIPDSVVGIGKEAFAGCNFESVTIPDSVKYLGEWAFWDCRKLERVDLPDTLTDIGTMVFAETPIAENRKNYKNGALYVGNHLISVDSDVTGSFNIKEGTVSVIDSAFSGCSGIKSITIPASVKSIGSLALSDCRNLKSVTVDPENPYYSNDKNGVFYNKDKSALLHYPGSKKGSYTVPDGVKIIGEYAFGDNDNLTGISFPDSVTDIGDEAFGGCSLLESVNFGSGLENIGDCAFWHCEAIDGIVFPDSLKTIGVDAFYDCDSISGIAVPAGVTRIGWQAFGDCGKLSGITIPDSVVKIEEYAFHYCDYYNTSSNWDDDMLYIGNHLIDVFAIGNECEVREGTVSISSYAFEGIPEGTVTIPESVIFIGDNAFDFDTEAVIRCYGGSYAHRYAEANGISYELIGDDDASSEADTPAPQQPDKAFAILPLILAFACAVMILSAIIVLISVLRKKKSKTNS